ncbi:replication-relaxation family protein [Priestia aryabhattai]|uniref:replication-relaxation family protein n=1 Tax=Priestia aryabhattai TaxID=412384 RepID=UPI003D28FBC2
MLDRETLTQLQYRDQLFLMDLYNLQFVDVEYLQESIYKGISKSTIHRRMNKLEQDGFIQSFRVPILNTRGGQSKNVYALGKTGSREVAALLGDITWRYDITDRVPSHVYHQLMLSYVYAAFQEDRLTPESEHKHPKFSLVQYVSEKNGYFSYDGKQDARESVTIRPDGILVIQNRETGKNAAFLLEVERSFQTKETTIKKLQRYNLYCQHGLYKSEHLCFDYPVSTPRVLFVAKEQKGIKRLLTHSAGIDTSSTSGVLFTSLEDIRRDPYGAICLAKDSTDLEKKYAITEPIK